MYLSNVATFFSLVVIMYSMVIKSLIHIYIKP
jgi:hypothetical protein